MSNGEEPFAASEDVGSRPTFDLALRGYDKGQVNRYIERLNGELSTLMIERDRTSGQVQNRTAELRQVQAELTDLRQRPARVDRASFRDLGPIVDQMLALAEKQAEIIANTAIERAAELEAEAEKVLLEARDRATRTLQDFEEELSARRADQKKTHEEHRLAAQAELAGIREAADRLRANGAEVHERAQQEAKRIDEQTAQQVEQARAESEAFMKAARTQIQQEMQAARAQTQQDLTQWQASVEREINERRAAAEQDITEQHAVAERELAGQRTAAEQEIGTLIAEAQEYSAKVRQRSDEQAAAHQQQLTAVQQAIRDRREAMVRLQAELDSAQQQLAQSRQEGATVEHEVTQLQQRLIDVRRDLSLELNRLEEARRSADSAERHAKDVRARVQREAKRVADLAAAAVMAAAAGGAETAEYPQVTARSGAEPGADRRTNNKSAEPPNDKVEVGN